MIYMPTDTTQLGYYYQLTPYWKARPNMIPPVPHPAEWHTPDFGVEFTGWADGNGYTAGSCPQGTVISDGIAVDSATPVPLMESNPTTPGSTVDSKTAPPPPEDPAPAPPAGTSAGNSAAMPELFPVPR